MEFLNKRQMRECISPTSMSTHALFNLYNKREQDPYLITVLQNKNYMDLEIDIVREGKYLHEDYPTKTLVMEYDDDLRTFICKHELDTSATNYEISIYGRDLQTNERKKIISYDMMRMSGNEHESTIYEALPEDCDTNISHTNNVMTWVPSKKEVELLFAKKSIWDEIASALYVPYMPYIIMMGITSVFMMIVFSYILAVFFIE